MKLNLFNEYEVILEAENLLRKRKRLHCNKQHTVKPSISSIQRKIDFLASLILER